MWRIVFLGCLIILVGCSPLHHKKGESEDAFIYPGGYQPLLDPTPLKKFTYDEQSLQKQKADIDYERFMNTYLPLEHITFGTSMLQNNFSGHYLPVGISTAGEDYRASLEYAKYTLAYIDVWKEGNSSDPTYSFEAADNRTKITVPVYIGIKIAINADFRSLSGGISITGFNKLGMEADAETIDGTLELKKAGMSSKTSSLLLLAPDTLSRESIAKAVTSFDKIKSLVYDKDMVITPCILGYYDLENNRAFNVFAQREMPRAIAQQYRESKPTGTRKLKGGPKDMAPSLNGILKSPFESLEALEQ